MLYAGESGYKSAGHGQKEYKLNARPKPRLLLLRFPAFFSCRQWFLLFFFILCHLLLRLSQRIRRRFDQSCGAEGRAGYRIHFGRLRFQHLVNNCNRLIVVGRVLTVCVQDIDRCKLSLCDRNGYIDLSAETCSAASRI